MDIEELIAAIDGSPLARHKSTLLAKLRPALDILRLAEGTPGRSHFGGSPDLPVGTAWPEHRRGPYRFVGQFDFAEMAGVDLGLPAAGVLAVFVGDDPEGDMDWVDPDYPRAIYSPAGTPLVTLPAPRPDLTCPEVAIGFRRTVDLPFDKAQFVPWPFSEDEEDEYL